MIVTFLSAPKKYINFKSFPFNKSFHINNPELTTLILLHSFFSGFKCKPFVNKTTIIVYRCSCLFYMYFTEIPGFIFASGNFTLRHFQWEKKYVKKKTHIFDYPIPHMIQLESNPIVLTLSIWINVLFHTMRPFSISYFIFSYIFSKRHYLSKLEHKSAQHHCNINALTIPTTYPAGRYIRKFIAHTTLPRREVEPTFGDIFARRRAKRFLFNNLRMGGPKWVVSSTVLRYPFPDT